MTIIQYLAASVIGLLAVALGFSTYRRWSEQNAAREAMAAFYSLSQIRDPDRLKKKSWISARKTVQAWSSKGNDPRRTLVFAGLRLEEDGKGLAEAAELYKRTAERRPNDAAPKLGAAVAALRRADATSGEKTAIIEAAEKAAKEAEGLGAAFEAKLLRGAIVLNRGEFDNALEIFREAGKDLDKRIPDRETLISYYWNLGLSELLAGSSQCVRNIARALQLRPVWPEASEALVLAVEVTLSRKGASKSAVELGRSIAEGKFRAGRNFRNRYGLDMAQVDRVRNAVAVAYIKVGDYEPARKLLKQAARKAKGSRVYRLNYIEACRLHAEQLEDARELALALGEAAKTAQLVAPGIKDPALRARVLLTAATLFHQLKRSGVANQCAQLALKTKAADAEAYRAIGIINLRTNRRGALDAFDKAIALKHPKTAEIQAKIAELGLR